MILLNIGCGEVLPNDPWINIDWVDRTAHNYKQLDLSLIRTFPWESNSVDGITGVHIFEHFDAIILARLLKDFHRMLKPNGVLRVVVPDATYFRKVFAQDNRQNAQKLFGEVLNHPEYNTFLEWALFLYEDHKQIFTEDSLWCTLINAGFRNINRVEPYKISIENHYCNKLVAELDNRPKFSLVMEAYK